MNWKRIVKKTLSYSSIMIITMILSSNIILLSMAFYGNNVVEGAYNPITDTYLCKRQLVCLHEEGHSVDAHGALWTGFWWDWRSTDESFRRDIDIIFNCMQTLFYEPARSHILTKQIVLVAINETILSTLDDSDSSRKYRETYAVAYSIIKLYRWDVYHYQDVEDMISQQAEFCQKVQSNIAFND